jgi:hypothetical protein
MQTTIEQALQAIENLAASASRIAERMPNLAASLLRPPTSAPLREGRARPCAQCVERRLSGEEKGEKIERFAYRLDEFAKACGVSPDFLRLEIQKGNLCARKTGSSKKNLVLILVEDAHAWLRNVPFYKANGAATDAQ